MENFDFPKQTSAPTFSKSSNKKDVSKNYSSVTHPSVCRRSREHLQSIFKKINSGDNVLSRIPTRLDPNVEFSDDEDEEPANTIIKRPMADSSKGKSNPEKVDGKENHKSFLAEIMKTPEPPRKVQFASSRRTSEIIKSHHKGMLSNQSSASKANFWDFFPKSNKSNDLSKDTVKLFAKSDENLPTIPKEKSNFSNKEKQCADISIKKINDTKSSSLSDDVIEVNGKLYNILSLLGSGGSCKVYSVYDTQNKVRVAIKRVNLKDTDPQIKRGYEQEIEYLQKLQSSNRVIKMYDFEYRENELLIVLEHGDIDLYKYICHEAKLKRLTPLKIKFYWSQMLEAVADIHKYGIVHSDLKPANFLLVEGSLKLIDFGIATSVPEDKTSTFRDTLVGTVNYMSPEAITQMSADGKQAIKVGVKSDVWSLGCILYNLVYDVTPFHSIKSVAQKICAITNPNYEIPFKPISDPLLLDVLKSCLKRNPKERASVEELLKHPYLAEENSTSTNIVSEIPTNSNLQNVLKQMQVLTPRRMRYVTKVVQELSGNSNT